MHQNWYPTLANSPLPYPAAARGRPQSDGRPAGFTLIELMVVVAIVVLLGSFALPAYQAYVARSRVPAGLDALQAYATRMEQRFQDSGSYADGAACALAVPQASNFALSCSLGGGGYTATATGSGPMSGYAYTIDHNGTRKTTGHPKGLPSADCWSIGGGRCDS